jgi:hypothetical protein
MNYLQNTNWIQVSYYILFLFGGLSALYDINSRKVPYFGGTLIIMGMALFAVNKHIEESKAA